LDWVTLKGEVRLLGYLRVVSSVGEHSQFGLILRAAWLRKGSMGRDSNGGWGEAPPHQAQSPNVVVARAIDDTADVTPSTEASSTYAPAQRPEVM
jgi:hypothetical protein